uniref:Uncharacterized protein n=1 Tax=Anguilla anguilla TaxID=7936 RepID=A0A0E9RPB7_ANGAN
MSLLRGPQLPQIGSQSKKRKQNLSLSQASKSAHCSIY